MFVDTCSKYMPEYSKRLKTHLILHLADNIMDCGPTSVFNTERLVHVISTTYTVHLLFYT